MKAISFRITGVLALALVTAIPILLSAFLSLSILASSTLSGLATNFLSKVGIETTEAILTKENARLSTKLNQAKGAAKLARNRVVERAVKSARRNIASMPAEAIPVIGVGTIAMVTALELDDMCAIMGFVDELTATMELAKRDVSAVQNYCRGWRNQLEKTSDKLKSVELSMRHRWESSEAVIGGAIYEACTSFNLCKDVGLQTEVPLPSQTPTKVSPSLLEEMGKQTTKYIEAWLTFGPDKE